MSEQFEQVIFFADVVGSTKLYEESGDYVAHTCISESLERVAEIINSNGGCVIETIGDEIMAVFESPKVASDCACDIHRVFASFVTSTGHTICFRIGFHYGNVGLKEGHPFGDTVNLASRVASLAEAGQTVTTDVSVENLQISKNFLCVPFGDVSVKGKADPVSTFKIEWDLDSATALLPRASQSGTSNEQEWVELNHGGTSVKILAKNHPYTLGRGEECDYVISSPSSSRVHLKIEYRFGAWYLIDRSTNGTYIRWPVGNDEASFKEELLHHGERVLVGEGHIGLGQSPMVEQENSIAFTVKSADTPVKLPC